jgi:hypothetical protein
MPFAFNCPSCQARLKAPDDSVGRVLACPHCKRPLVVKCPVNPPPPPGAIQLALPEARRDEPVKGDAYQDFEIVGDADEDEDEPYEDLEIEQEGGAEDIPEVLPATSEDVPEVLPAGEADLHADSELLRLPRLFIEGRAGNAADLFVSAPNSYDFYEPDTRRWVGEAAEVRDGALTAMHSLIRGSEAWTTARIEVCEGRDRVLLCSVRRPPHLWTSRVEILSSEDEPLGYFTWKAFSRLLSQPFPVHDADGRLLLQMRPEFLRGRLNFLDARGRYLGNMMTAAAYLGRARIAWVPRGGSYYVTFGPRLERRPRYKLLLLGAALGLDLIDTEGGGVRIT